MFFLDPHWLILLLPAALGWWYILRSQRGRWLRLASLITAIVLLGNPVYVAEIIQPQVMILTDRSASVGSQGLIQAQEILTSLTQRHPNTQVSLLAFGRGASLLKRANDISLDNYNVEIHDDSNLHAGLQLAAGIAGQGQQNLLIISDGRHTGNDPLSELPLLRDKNIRIFYHHLKTASGADTAIARVNNPSRAAVGQPFEIAAQIYSPKSQTGSLILKDGQNELARTEVRLNTGDNAFVLNWQADTPGLSEYTLAIEVDNDPVLQNNEARLAIDIIGAPRILVLNKTASASNLGRALEQGNATVEYGHPTASLTSAKLKNYQAVVLENMPLDRLADGADAAIAHYVRRLGGGLLVTGGRDSYAQGGYFHSFLEDILPLALEREEELRRSKIAMAIVLDRSGSMGVGVQGGGVKMDLANRGAAEGINLLSRFDEIAVYAVDSQAHEVVSLQAIKNTANRDRLIKKTLTIEAGGGGIFVYEGLSTAVEALLNSNAITRHIVLFADAADAEQPGEYKKLIEQWRNAGGTISVVGLGTTQDSDAEFLIDIAKRGNGRMFFTADVMNLPRIFAQDVVHIARKTFHEQTTTVSATSNLSALKFVPDTIPSVDGYNITRLQPDAQLMLVSTGEHSRPIAAGWQRGSGKVLALSIEAAGTFTGNWQSWQDYPAFFLHAIEWIKRPKQDVSLVADVQVTGRQAKIVLEVSPDIKLTELPKAVIIPPDEGEPLLIPLHWQDPFTLIGHFELEQEGLYHGAIELTNHNPILLPPRVLPYSPEFAPQNFQVDGELQLEKLARATGGKIYTHVSDLVRDSASVQSQPLSLTPWLALVLMVLLLSDIAHRRGLIDPVLNRIKKATTSRPKVGKPEQPAVQSAEQEVTSVFKTAKRRAR